MPDGTPRDVMMHLFRNSENDEWVPRYLLARLNNYSTDVGGVLNDRSFICTDESGKYSYAYRYCVPHPNNQLVPKLLVGAYPEPTLMNIPPLRAGGKLWKLYLAYTWVVLEEIVEVKEPGGTFVKVDVPSVTESAAKPESSPWKILYKEGKTYEK